MYELVDQSQTNQSEPKSNAVTRQKRAASERTDSENDGVPDNSSKSGQAAQLQVIADQFISKNNPFNASENYQVAQG